MRTRASALVIGHAVDDPEFHDSDGTAWCSLPVATTRGLEEGRGERKDVHRVVFFGRIAQNVGRYVRRGSAIVVEGRIEYDAKGRAEIVAREASFIKNEVPQ